MNKLFFTKKLLCAFVAMVTISVSATAQNSYRVHRSTDGLWGYIIVNDIGQFQRTLIVDSKIIDIETYSDKWPTGRDYALQLYKAEDSFPFEGEGCFSYSVEGAGKNVMDTDHLLPPLHRVPEASFIDSVGRPISVFPMPLGDPALSAGSILSKSAYWRGSRLFVLKNDQWLLIAQNTIAYLISKKNAIVELKPDSKNMYLPMRLGDDPFIDYKAPDTVAVSSCAYKGTIYISTNRGAIATISLGEKPAWSKAQQPFGVSETRLFSDGTTLYAFTRKQEKDDWQIYRLGADDKWVETKFAKLPAARTPLYVSENYFVTSSTVAHPWLDQWILQERVDICHWNKDKGWGERAITMEPQGIVMDIAENEKTHALHILMGQELKDMVNLSIQQTVFKFPSADDDKIIVPPPAEEQTRVD